MCLGTPKGYGSLGNSTEIVRMRKLSPEDQKVRIKKLYDEDPKKYFEWKEMCIRLDQLPELFGTSDNPIPIDESKL